VSHRPACHTQGMRRVYQVRRLERGWNRTDQGDLGWIIVCAIDDGPFVPLTPSWEYDSEAVAQAEADRLSVLTPPRSYPRRRRRAFSVRQQLEEAAIDCRSVTFHNGASRTQQIKRVAFAVADKFGRTVAVEINGGDVVVSFILSAA
jgi:hypothetical protein